MLEVAGITIAVVGACALALWLMLRPGSVAHRARDAEAGDGSRRRGDPPGDPPTG